MEIKQFRYAADNLGYLIYGSQEAMAIDGGAVREIMAFAAHKNLRIKYAVNTHGHPDHTSGTRELLELSGAVLLDHRQLLNQKTVTIDTDDIQVYATPGHTKDSICFHFNDVLVTGDTLFVATIGNCFSGDFKDFFDSLKFLMTLPGDTRIYPGHDYVQESIQFAKKVEPNNSYLDRALKNYNPDDVFSTLKGELRINLFLKFNDEAMIARLEGMGKPVKTEFERWRSIYETH
jgi:hydroxyacylglutathione hydrolase